jgi:Phage integrase, N-terminal SAM-like domain
VYTSIVAQYRALFEKEYTMNKTETNRFKKLYQRHLRLLKLQGKAQKTIDAYSRAVRRISEYFDCCPDQLTLEQLEKYFSKLVDSHSWSTVKIDRNGLQFFWKHVLNAAWPCFAKIWLMALPTQVPLDEIMPQARAPGQSAGKLHKDVCTCGTA